MSEINWADLLRAGVLRLGLRPVEFWALTPGELMLILGLQGGSAPLTRDRLDELVAAFPDSEKDKS